MRNQKLAFAILLPLLLGLGFGVAFALAGTEAHAPASSAQESDAARELVSVVRSLARQIDHLEHTLGAGSDARRELHVAASEDDGGSEPAVAGEGALLAALERLNAHLDGAPESRSPIGAARELGGAATPKQSDALAPLLSQSEEDRSRAHCFLTYQQILNRYGRPDSLYVAPEGTLAWIYTEPRSGGQLGFTFFDGFVIRVWGGLPQSEDRAN